MDPDQGDAVPKETASGPRAMIALACVEGSNLDLRLNKREQAIADEIRRSTFLGESDLCRIAVRKLLNLWDRTPEYSLPGAPADRAVLTENLRAMARELPR